MKHRTSSRSCSTAPFGAWVAGLILMASSPVAGAPLQDETAGDAAELSVSAAAQPCLNVRSRPSYRALLIDCLDVGTRVTVTRTRDGWSYVSAGDRSAGWVGSRFLMESLEGAPEPSSQSPPGETETATPAGEPVSAGDLAPARSAWEAAAAEASELSSRVEELTAERDSLARQLARAEARVLFLQADLEETRAELMRLKGIPPKLVRFEPAPEPEPVAPPIEPEPEPAVAEAPESLELPAQANVVVLDEVVATVRAWAQAWSDQRVDDYLSFYSSSFDPGSGESRASWEARRRDRVAAPDSIEVVIDRVNPIVRGDRASVMFVQTYISDSFSDTVSKTLTLERGAAGSWQIVEERAEELG